MSWNIGENKYPQVATFWKVQEDKGTYATVSLSTSKKDKDKNWHNSNWSYVRFVGNAYDDLKSLKEKDKIIIKAGQISREPYKDKGEKVVWPKNEQITVFAWTRYEPEDRGEVDTPPQVEEDSDELPF